MTPPQLLSAASPASLGLLFPSDAAGGSLRGDFKDPFALVMERYVCGKVSPLPGPSTPTSSWFHSSWVHVSGGPVGPGGAEPGRRQVCWWQLGALGL